jgi:hypothetical protein
MVGDETIATIGGIKLPQNVKTAESDLSGLGAATKGLVKFI